MFYFSICLRAMQTSRSCPHIYYYCLWLFHLAINGDWDTWSSWGPCSVTCGLGTQSQTRSCCNPPPQFDGAQCVGESENSQSCDSGVTCRKSVFFVSRIFYFLLVICTQSCDVPSLDSRGILN